MSAPLVQVGAVSSVTTGSSVPSITGVTAGNTLICVLGSTAFVTWPAPTDSAGQTWTIAAQTSNNNLGHSSAVIAYLLNANAGTHTLTWQSQSGTIGTSAAISEFSGITAIGGTAAVANNSSNSTSLASGSYAPSRANEIVIGTCTNFGTTTPENISDPPAGFDASIAVQQAGATLRVFEGCYHVITTTAAVSATWNWTDSVAASCVVQGFQFPGLNPTFTAQPVQQTVASGGTATFNCAATSNAGGTISYQWYYCPVGGTFASISGATSGSYTTGAQTASNIGDAYYCLVTDSVAGSYASAAAKLMLSAQPSQGSANSTAFDGWFWSAKGADLRPHGSFALARDWFYASSERNQATVGGTKAAFGNYAFGSATLSGAIAAADAADVAAAGSSVTTGASLIATDGADLVGAGAACWTTAQIGAADAADATAAVAIATSASIAAGDGADAGAIAAANSISASIAPADAPDAVAMVGGATLGALAVTDAADAAAAGAAVTTGATISGTDAVDAAAVLAIAAVGSIVANDGADANTTLARVTTGAAAAAVDASDASSVAVGAALARVAAQDTPDVHAASATTTATTLASVAGSDAGDAAASVGAAWTTGQLAAVDASDAAQAGVGVTTGAAVAASDGPDAPAAAIAACSGFAALVEAADIVVAAGTITVAGAIGVNDAWDEAALSGILGSNTGPTLKIGFEPTRLAVQESARCTLAGGSSCLVLAESTRLKLRPEPTVTGAP